jgi:hypothetical protein
VGVEYQTLEVEAVTMVLIPYLAQLLLQVEVARLKQLEILVVQVEVEQITQMV